MWMGKKLCGSPFSVFVRVPPSQLKQPVKRIKGVKCLYGIAVSRDEVVLVAEDGGVRVFDKQGRNILRKIKHTDLPDPRGVAV